MLAGSELPMCTEVLVKFTESVGNVVGVFKMCTHETQRITEFKQLRFQSGTLLCLPVTPKGYGSFARLIVTSTKWVPICYRAQLYCCWR